MKPERIWREDIRRWAVIGVIASVVAGILIAVLLDELLSRKVVALSHTLI